MECPTCRRVTRFHRSTGARALPKNYELVRARQEMELQTQNQLRRLKDAWTTQVKEKELLAKEAEAYLRERGFPVFTARLHQYIAFREAIGRGLTVREYEPTGKATCDLAQVYDELQEYCNGNQKA